MPLGPGKYDNLCTLIRSLTQAEAIFLAVVNGANGSGFSVQVTDDEHHTVALGLAAGLRAVADQIEKELKPGK